VKQSEIATKYQISRDILNRALNGKADVKRMTAENAVKLAKILDWEVDQLLRAKPISIKQRFFRLHELTEG